MKKSILKSVLVGALSIFMATTLVAQTKSTGKTKKNVKAIEKTKVPTAITNEFNRECPSVEFYTWYGYPTLRNELEWYDYNPMYYTCDYPEYYEVEYVKDKKTNKAVYNKEGKKVATHTKLNADVMPAAVKTAIDSSTYKSWEQTDEKEEIEKITTSEKVYKITVEKNGKKHNLFYNEMGKLLKDEKVMLK